MSQGHFYNIGHLGPSSSHNPLTIGTPLFSSHQRSVDGVASASASANSLPDCVSPLASSNLSHPYTTMATTTNVTSSSSLSSRRPTGDTNRGNEVFDAMPSFAANDDGHFVMTNSLSSHTNSKASSNNDVPRRRSQRAAASTATTLASRVARDEADGHHHDNDDDDDYQQGEDDNDDDDGENKAPGRTGSSSSSDARGDDDCDEDSDHQPLARRRAAKTSASSSSSSANKSSARNNNGPLSPLSTSVAMDEGGDGENDHDSHAAVTHVASSSSSSSSAISARRNKVESKNAHTSDDDNGGDDNDDNDDDHKLQSEVDSYYRAVKPSSSLSDVLLTRKLAEYLPTRHIQRSVNILRQCLLRIKPLKTGKNAGRMEWALPPIQTRPLPSLVRAPGDGQSLAPMSTSYGTRLFPIRCWQLRDLDFKTSGGPAYSANKHLFFIEIINTRPPIPKGRVRTKRATGTSAVSSSSSSSATADNGDGSGPKNRKMARTRIPGLRPKGKKGSLASRSVTLTGRLKSGTGEDVGHIPFTARALRYSFSIDQLLYDGADSTYTGTASHDDIAAVKCEPGLEQLVPHHRQPGIGGIRIVLDVINPSRHDTGLNPVCKVKPLFGYGRIDFNFVLRQLGTFQLRISIEVDNERLTGREQAIIQAALAPPQPVSSSDDAASLSSHHSHSSSTNGIPSANPHDDIMLAGGLSLTQVIRDLKSSLEAVAYFVYDSPTAKRQKRYAGIKDLPMNYMGTAIPLLVAPSSSASSSSSRMMEDIDGDESRAKSRRNKASSSSSSNSDSKRNSNNKIRVKAEPVSPSPSSPMPMTISSPQMPPPLSGVKEKKSSSRTKSSSSSSAAAPAVLPDASTTIHVPVDARLLAAGVASYNAHNKMMTQPMYMALQQMQQLQAKAQNAFPLFGHTAMASSSSNGANGGQASSLPPWLQAANTQTLSFAYGQLLAQQQAMMNGMNPFINTAAAPFTNTSSNSNNSRSQSLLSSASPSASFLSQLSGLPISSSVNSSAAEDITSERNSPITNGGDPIFDIHDDTNHDATHVLTTAPSKVETLDLTLDDDVSSYFTMGTTTSPNGENVPLSSVIVGAVATSSMNASGSSNSNNSNNGSSRSSSLLLPANRKGRPRDVSPNPTSTNDTSSMANPAITSLSSSSSPGASLSIPPYVPGMAVSQQGSSNARGMKKGRVDSPSAALMDVSFVPPQYPNFVTGSATTAFPMMMTPMAMGTTVPMMIAPGMAPLFHTSATTTTANLPDAAMPYQAAASSSSTSSSGSSSRVSLDTLYRLPGGVGGNVMASGNFVQMKYEAAATSSPHHSVTSPVAVPMTPSTPMTPATPASSSSREVSHMLQRFHVDNNGSNPSVMTSSNNTINAYGIYANSNDAAFGITTGVLDCKPGGPQSLSTPDGRTVTVMCEGAWPEATAVVLRFGRIGYVVASGHINPYARHERTFLIPAIPEHVWKAATDYVASCGQRFVHVVPYLTAEVLIVFDSNINGRPVVGYFTYPQPIPVHSVAPRRTGSGSSHDSNGSNGGNGGNGNGGNGGDGNNDRRDDGHGGDNNNSGNGGNGNNGNNNGGGNDNGNNGSRTGMTITVQQRFHIPYHQFVSLLLLVNHDSPLPLMNHPQMLQMIILGYQQLLQAYIMYRLSSLPDNGQLRQQFLFSCFPYRRVVTSSNERHRQHSFDSALRVTVDQMLASAACSPLSSIHEHHDRSQPSIEDMELWSSTPSRQVVITSSHDNNDGEDGEEGEGDSWIMEEDVWEQPNNNDHDDDEYDDEGDDDDSNISSGNDEGDDEADNSDGKVEARVRSSPLLDRRASRRTVASSSSRGASSGDEDTTEGEGEGDVHRRDIIVVEEGTGEDDGWVVEASTSRASYYDRDEEHTDDVTATDQTGDENDEDDGDHSASESRQPSRSVSFVGESKRMARAVVPSSRAVVSSSTSGAAAVVPSKGSSDVVDTIPGELEVEMTVEALALLLKQALQLACVRAIATKSFNHRDQWGLTLSHYITVFGNPMLIRLAMNHGADLSLTSTAPSPAAVYAASLDGASLMPVTPLSFLSPLRIDSLPLDKDHIKQLSAWYPIGAPPLRLELVTPVTHRTVPPPPASDSPVLDYRTIRVHHQHDDAQFIMKPQPLLGVSALGAGAGVATHTLRRGSPPIGTHHPLVVYDDIKRRASPSTSDDGSHIIDMTHHNRHHHREMSQTTVTSNSQSPFVAVPSRHSSASTSSSASTGLAASGGHSVSRGHTSGSGNGGSSDDVELAIMSHHRQYTTAQQQARAIAGDMIGDQVVYIHSPDGRHRIRPATATPNEEYPFPNRSVQLPHKKMWPLLAWCRAISSTRCAIASLITLLIAITVVVMVVVFHLDRSLGDMAVTGEHAYAKWALPSFPDAAGHGANTGGGRGGAVWVVNNLLTNGEDGSLQWAIDQPGTRTIVFDVQGVIEGDIWIDRGDLTIAGQTAPGVGITIHGSVLVQGSVSTPIGDIIIRNLRIRAQRAPVLPSKASDWQPAILSTYQRHALMMYAVNNMVMDHLTLSWSLDSIIYMEQCRNVTLQWSTLEEPMLSTYDSSSPLVVDTTVDKTAASSASPTSSLTAAALIQAREIDRLLNGDDESDFTTFATATTFPEADDTQRPGYSSSAIVCKASTHLTFHHNLIAHASRAGPQIDGAPVDIRNNVIHDYNMAFYHMPDTSLYDVATDSIDYPVLTARGGINIIGNYYSDRRWSGGGTQPMLNTSGLIDKPAYWRDLYQWMYAGAGMAVPFVLAPGYQYCIRDNYVEGIGSVDDPWQLWSFWDSDDKWTYQKWGLNYAVHYGTQHSEYISVNPPVDTGTSGQAYDLVLAYAGAFPRDAITTRIVTEVRHQSGWQGRAINETITNNVTSTLVDTDGDGVPDSFETKNQWSLANTSDSDIITPNGYSVIERWTQAEATSLIAAAKNTLKTPDTTWYYLTVVNGRQAGPPLDGGVEPWTYTELVADDWNTTITSNTNTNGNDTSSSSSLIWATMGRYYQGTRVDIEDTWLVTHATSTATFDRWRTTSINDALLTNIMRKVDRASSMVLMPAKNITIWATYK